MNTTTASSTTRPSHGPWPGSVGVYPDFDRHRQETVWRVLSSDRQALLTFCQRQGISVGRMETIKTLKSPKPLYQLMAVGHDAADDREVAAERTSGVAADRRRLRRHDHRVRTASSRSCRRTRRSCSTSSRMTSTPGGSRCTSASSASSPRCGATTTRSWRRRSSGRGCGAGFAEFVRGRAGGGPPRGGGVERVRGDHPAGAGARGCARRGAVRARGAVLGPTAGWWSSATARSATSAGRSASGRWSRALDGTAATCLRR